MILRMPAYCGEFRCIADQCRDSCCIGWEIDIDSDTAAFYDTVEGPFGERLNANITADSPRSFILDGQERCPFLNDRNLCDIILQLGEAHLCQICDEHPRYYEWFEGVKEGGIGLCCEEAARLILTQKRPLTFREREIPEESADIYDPELFACLCGARERILAHLEDGTIPLGMRIRHVLFYAEDLQSRTDQGMYAVPDIAPEAGAAQPDLPAIFALLQGMEPMAAGWQPRLAVCAGMYDRVKAAAGDFAAAHPEVSQYLQNMAVYFVWRYFLKGVFDEEFLSRIKFMAVSTAVIGYLFVCRWLEQGTLSPEDCAEIAKDYSKEMEYCQENLDAFADSTYEQPWLSAVRIAGLFGWDE